MGVLGLLSDGNKLGGGLGMRPYKIPAVFVVITYSMGGVVSKLKGRNYAGPRQTGAVSVSLLPYCIYTTLHHFLISLDDSRV